MNNKKLIPLVTSFPGKAGYGQLLTDISGIIVNGRNIALRQINTTQVITYWLVGRRIVEFHQGGKERAGYGEALLKKLSDDLISRYGKGYSERNLEMMRQFYIEYPISQTLSAKLKDINEIPKSLSAKFVLSWSNYCELLKEDNNKIFASKYKLTLPTEKELDRKLCI